MSKSQIREIVIRYIQKLKHEGIPVQDVFLFGSTAKGKSHQGSDIDLCIISSHFGKNRFEERLRLMNLREGISDLIEPHPYSMEDFNNRFDALSNEIKRYGIRIQ